jgi:hypothetical protein
MWPGCALVAGATWYGKDEYKDEEQNKSISNYAAVHFYRLFPQYDVISSPMSMETDINTDVLITRPDNVRLIYKLTRIKSTEIYFVLIRVQS